MSESARVLLVTWDGAGNLPPERSLLRALVARGHTVRVLAHPSVREAIERDGAEFLPVRGARHYDSREGMPPEEEMPFVIEHIWFAEAFGSELSAAVERLRPDLLLIDACLVYALLAARHSGLPTAVLCHSPYQLLIGPFAPVFAANLAKADAYVTPLGMAPVRSHQALMESAPLVLVASYRAFDDVEGVAPNVAHVGPLRDPDHVGAAWKRQSPDRPLVLVGLSTSQQHQGPLLQRLCDALGGLAVEALVTTGPSVSPEALRVGENTTVRQFVAHDQVLPSASLLVTHAGHGTIMAGATYGVPMLCLPMGRDQPMNAERVAHLGLGAVLDPEAPVDALGRAIAATLADAHVARRAKDFARSLAGHPGLPQAIGLIEQLIPHRR